jgi:hypothetical protein
LAIIPKFFTGNIFHIFLANPRQEVASVTFILHVYIPAPTFGAYNGMFVNIQVHFDMYFEIGMD